MIRRRIIAGSVALFVAAWLLITIVLVSGHDPALAKQSSASSVASSSPSTARRRARDSTSGTAPLVGFELQLELEPASSGGGTVSSVTTSQS